jgi:hypothetical protein
MNTTSINVTTTPFQHRLAEGYGLSAEDTHQRFADEFRSANLGTSIDKTSPPASGKAALYALMMAMWSAIIFGAVMAMAWGG